MTIAALLDYAYQQGEKKLDLTQTSMHAIKLEPDAEAAEIDQVTQLASNDPLVDVPPKLLSSLAALGAQPVVRKRLIQLVTVALAHHPLFEGRQDVLIGTYAANTPLAAELAARVNELEPQIVGVAGEEEFTAAKKERLKVNVISAYALLCVLRGEWTSAQFIEAMSSAVWVRPTQPSVQKTAALLASSKAIDELSQLTAHHSSVLRRAHHELDFSTAEASELRRQSAEAKTKADSLALELEHQSAKLAESTSQVAQLKQQLADERSGRSVDHSHAVDDFEHLRSRVLRRLSSQVGMLTDGLHAVRNGRTSVAEEFVERALDAIKGEVDALKDLDEGAL
ncbi:hypothetical protein [Gordonia hongkongensis]|uniref:hypothetical protein n=1 Tax=Gordonia hongkongensis TaxID=1701090 RepID=UPI001FFB2426|nr:hypothetical protein [Gordonia hongkongensis]UPG68196.1 hypothetical protein MVF96_23020 [Gordonia hongkongensis]